MTALSQRKFNPDYLSIDYHTYKNRIIEVLKNTEEFKDYNFEGSNISVLIELLAYQNELSTYYLNRISSELYDDTAQLYENIHRIAKMKGYDARGYVSAKGTATISIPQHIDETLKPNFDFGDVLAIEKWTNFTANVTNLSDQKGEEINKINFINLESIQISIPEYTGLDVTNLNCTFDVPIIQGEIEKLVYSGTDIVDGKIILPFNNYHHTDAISNKDSLTLFVNGKRWKQVDNFYSGVTNTTEIFNEIDNKVFTFKYDKFKRYIIEFSVSKYIPEKADEIEITLIKTLGELGNLGANMISNVESDKILNISKNKIFSYNDRLTVTNKNTLVGGLNPQDIPDLIAAGKGNINSQERCVTRMDYINFLKARQDIQAANVYGEKEISKKGNVKEYNKIYCTIVPTNFNSSTMELVDKEWITELKTGKLRIPKGINPEYAEDLKLYLEPRKFISTYEEFITPEFIHFAFHISIRIQKHYSFIEVANALMHKLKYYFAAKNRAFNEKISFMDIHNFLLDVNFIALNKHWTVLSGLENVVFRNIWVDAKYIPDWKIDFYKLPKEGGKYIDGEGKEVTIDYGYDTKIPYASNIYPPNRELVDYPMYTKNEYIYNIENKMKEIKLGHNQFPVLAEDFCFIEEEK